MKGAAMADLRQAIKRAYRKTVVYRLDSLQAEESRWARKATIASNKLRDVRKRINVLAGELAAKHLEAVQ
jgi:hypothetical protein